MQAKSDEPSRSTGEPGDTIQLTLQRTEMNCDQNQVLDPEKPI